VLPVPEILKRDVECFSVIEYSGKAGIDIEVSPSSVPGIVFQQIQGQSAIEKIVTRSGVVSGVPTAFLYGPGLEPSVMHYRQGAYSTINVILKPHALNAVLGINASTLSNEYVPLSEFADNDLAGQLVETVEEEGQIALLTNFLVSLLEQAKHRDEAIEAGLQFVQQNIASVTVKDVFDHLSLSERQFQRRFSQTVGITPRSYIRVRRFHEAIRLIKSGHYERLTDVAYALNYYDQSHLIRDIKAFSGVTPRNVSENEDDFYHMQTGYSFLGR
jgi:AraC-like DNA-binding protein